MAAVVPFASCYASVQPLQLFGRGPRGGNYLLLLTNRGPRCAPRPRLAYHAPKMTLRQICRMLKVMKQIRKREAAATASPPRKQGSASPAPASPGAKSEKKCVPSCLRRKRSIKRVSWPVTPGWLQTYYLEETYLLSHSRWRGRSSSSVPLQWKGFNELSNDAGGADTWLAAH